MLEPIYFEMQEPEGVFDYALTQVSNNGHDMRLLNILAAGAEVAAIGECRAIDADTGNVLESNCDYTGIIFTRGKDTFSAVICCGSPKALRGDPAYMPAGLYIAREVNAKFPA